LNSSLAGSNDGRIKALTTPTGALPLRKTLEFVDIGHPGARGDGPLLRPDRDVIQLEDRQQCPLPLCCAGGTTIRIDDISHSTQRWEEWEAAGPTISSSLVPAATGGSRGCRVVDQVDLAETTTQCDDPNAVSRHLKAISRVPLDLPGQG